MSIVSVYCGPSSDGVSSDANTGLTDRSHRVATPARYKAVIAALPAGDTAWLKLEGNLHQGLSGWAVVSGTMASFSSGDTNMQGVRISATNTEDPAAPLPVICSYDQITSAPAWTNTATTTAAGTPIWSTPITGGGVRMLWAADWLTNAKFWRSALWEGGANYTSTFTNIHPNLDKVPGLNVFGTGWTCYNAAGTLGTTLFMACPINPFTFYGIITYCTDQMNAVMSIAGISNWQVDREVTIRGGGAYSVSLFAPGPGRFDGKILGSHPYLEPIGIESTVTGPIILAPYIDPQYPYEVPFYPANSTGHNVGSNHGISIKASCSLVGATNYGNGIRVVARALNGERTMIRDMFHAGVGEVPPSVGLVHRFVSIEDDVAFDFAKVPYGRAFAWGGTLAQSQDFKVGAIQVFNQPTQSQMNGDRAKAVGGFYHSKENVGNGYVGPWGVTSNKIGTSVGIACYTSTSTQMRDIELYRNTFYCDDGGYTFDTFNGVAVSGAIRTGNNLLVQTGKPQYTDSIVTVPRAIGLSFNGTADQAWFSMRDNVLSGFSGACVRRFQTSPAINDAVAVTACIPVAQTTDWQEFPDWASLQQAQRVGQVL